MPDIYGVPTSGASDTSDVPISGVSDAKYVPRSTSFWISKAILKVFQKSEIFLALLQYSGGQNPSYVKFF